MMADEIAPLRDQINALIERNRYLEAQNLQLRQEAQLFRNQIQSLKERDRDEKSMLAKKLHASSLASNCTFKEKQLLPDNYNLNSKQKVLRLEPKAKEPRVPKPPPSLKQLQATQNVKIDCSQAPPPPPPPPLSSKLQGGGPLKSVRRVPEVVELYRILTRKEGKVDAKTGSVGIPVAMNPREMIGEIENRSAYVLAIKSDVESQGEFINFLAKEVDKAAYKDMADVESFVKWLDEELSYLVDERAVLKHFSHWPEKKADTMREAACSYRDLKNLESEVASFHDDPTVIASVALKRVQALQDKLEHGVHNIERVRDSTSKRYRDFKIPWEWMLDTGIVSQIKLGSLKLVRIYMNRVVSAFKCEQFLDDEDLVLNGARFAFRVHQVCGFLNFQQCYVSTRNLFLTRDHEFFFLLLLLLLLLLLFSFSKLPVCWWI
ncbi:Hydroxyproline-rich glycoprotein family protein [Rhynchospora pubera]|uniref:Hydroxyproline-rich glycoprotein family protein n=1 Tax=Rhynchospora pubera TaxID=906938 RepID=A0AAV8HGB5_9POAL|nr:Hydroxyproline-rich glycoprotein family protein [Rhynchospora pubera]